MLRSAIGLFILAGCSTARVGPNARDFPVAPPPKAQPQAENWCVYTLADEAGNLVFITVNLEYKNYQHKADFPYFLHINVSTGNQNPNGHPTTEEALVLNQVEDEITAALQDVTPVRLLGRVTTKGFREIMYFVREAEKAKASLMRLAAARPRRPWEFSVFEDPEWTRAQPVLGSDSECP